MHDLHEFYTCFILFMMEILIGGMSAVYQMDCDSNVLKQRVPLLALP